MLDDASTSAWVARTVCERYAGCLLYVPADPASGFIPELTALVAEIVDDHGRVERIAEAFCRHFVACEVYFPRAADRARKERDDRIRREAAAGSSARDLIARHGITHSTLYRVLRASPP